MKNKFRWLILLLVSAPTPLFAEVSLKDLIKVSKENNPRCVEYYNYAGQVYCSTKALSTGAIDVDVLTDEKQDILFDSRTWRAAWGKKTDAVVTIEYIPAEGKIMEWRELVTSQFIPGIQDSITPIDFANSVIENLQNSGLSPKITFHQKTPEQVIFEFSIASPENLKQDELQKITKGKDGFYVLHYVIKETDMGDEIRNQWLQNLKDSQIKPAGNEAPHTDKD
ncbi:hypothetical protein [Legionella septentrionalis]|uniref:Uncharacterized protein n=1 Tax=Legionella septentrionalis TaxID=2498109 RepID=A0A3S0V9L9_9GAMM|nr:hypothetical protein [Legionella septentrionalis]RUQ81019.1 hypothetical protein EKM59_10905 [Legionella septentrionalis]